MSPRKKVLPAVKNKVVPKKKLKFGDKKKGEKHSTEFEIEKIIEYCESEDGKILYHVKWRGWDNTHNTWEPEKNLTGCENIIIRYFRKTFGSDADKVKNQFRSEMKALKSELIGDAPRETLETIMNKFQTKKGLCLVYPSTGDVDNDLLTLMRIPENERPAVYVSKVKEDLLLLALQEKRQQQLKLLEDWEQKLNTGSGIIKSNDTDQTDVVIINGDTNQTDIVTINDINNGIANKDILIFVENNVDLEGPPPNFNYITDYIPREGVTIPNDPVIGCKCSPQCDRFCTHCCGLLSGSKFAYYPDGRIRVPHGTPIYECNSRCKCSSDCINRVVQKGCRVKLTIFRTSNGCGWGVKAAENIKRGTFVCEYAGEVITNQEAEKRGKIYDAQGMTYLFDLDFTEEQPYTVDAAVYGNISHFINHSCNPNLSVFAVWIECLDINLPKLAIFANRFIRQGEEITFDYKCQRLRNAETQENGEISSNPPSPTQENGEVSSNSPSPTQENGEVSSNSPLPTEENGKISTNPQLPTEENSKVSSNFPSPVTLAIESPSCAQLSIQVQNSSNSNSNLNSVTKGIMVCKCGASNCRKYIVL